MDPLSATLAAVALVTAVKDMVELGQKIHESFAKVSKNLCKAQSMAKSIRDMVEEIEVFCEVHKDVLANTKEFLLALQGLLGKFQNIETSILPLLPKTGRSKFGLFLRGWLNNNKIQESMSNLESDVMKSTLRIEVKQETNHQEMRTGLTDVHRDITQGFEVLEVVRRDVSAIRTTTAATAMTRFSYEFLGSGSTNDTFDQNVIMFAESSPSASTPMLRTPSEITEEIMTTTYIRLQVNHIVMALDKISKLPAPVPNSDNTFRMSLVSTHWQKSMSITRLQRHVLRQILNIHDLLDTERMQTVSIFEGARALHNLSFDLGAIHMGHESAQIGKWAVMLVRTLVDTSPSGHPDLCAALALYLTNQSVQYYVNGDKIQSLQAIKEADAIARSLRNRYDHFQILYSGVLLQYAQLVDIQRSIEILVEAVLVLEEILGVRGFTQSQSPVKVDKVVQPSPSFLDRLFYLEPPVLAITNYALALQRLGNYLFKAGDPESAVDLELLAIEMRRKIVSIYGQEYKADLAITLSSLVRGENARSRIPAKELVDMAEDCIQLFRTLAEINPLFYALQLINVLWAKAKTLETLNRGVDAIAAWKEVVSLAGQFVEDSRVCAAALGSLGNQFRRLGRYCEAAQTTREIAAYQHGSETQAVRYMQLSMDLEQLRRHKDSAEAARTAVTLWRHVAMRDPGKWTSTLTLGLSRLAHCLAASGDCSEALIAWKDSVNMLEIFLSTIPDASSPVDNNYIASLQTHTVISWILEDEEDSLEVSSIAVRYFRQVSQICGPQNSGAIVNLLWAEFCHVYNLLRVGRLQDGLQYIKEWLDMWRGKLEATSDSETARWHATMIAMKSNILNAQGRTEEALLATHKVNDIVEPFVSTHQPSFAEMIKSMNHNARLQMDLDKSEEALEVAETALRLARDNSKLDPAERRPVRSLHGVASIALLCRNYERAAEVAQEGCDICASPVWHNDEGEHNILWRPSLYAILSSAEANLSRHSTALEYAHRAVEESLDIREMKSDISATTAEQSYMETRGNLADILLATGDLAQARQICEERSAYFSERAEKRTGDYRELAPILRMLGILCCSEGRHEEGDAAAQKLARIMKTLGSAFLSLQKEVKIRLRNQAKVPILMVLEDLSKKLDCGHQADIPSFFKG